jgi:eukaryotic-like serine/threonine-protein kinase
VDGAGWQIFKKKADGSGPEEFVLKLPGETVFPTDWSRNGRFLIFIKSAAVGSTLETLGALPLGPGQTPVLLSPSTGFAETLGRLSPDGHYLAYYSNETGRNEVYVRTFSPDPGGEPAGKWLVSSSGGQAPQWAPDGKRLMWVSQAVVYGASIDTSHGFHAGVPEVIYPATGGTGGAAMLTSKGQGLLLKPAGQAADEPINVLVNWMSAIKAN